VLRDFLVIGNPDNRRVKQFAAAAHGLGASVAIESWRDVIADARCLIDRQERSFWVRVESWGEDTEVERALLRRGLGKLPDGSAASRLGLDAIDAATAEHGRIAAPRQAHAGVLAVLDELGLVLAERPGWHCLQPLSAIRTLFDKPATHALCRKLAIRVPRALPTVSTPEALLAAMTELELRRVFVKLSSGSSASCLGLLELGVHGPSLLTSMESVGQKLYNSLVVRRYARPAVLERLLRFLLAEGAHVEEAVDKLPSAGRHADVRLLCLPSAEPFAVLRESRVPMTNLHLGGRRGDRERYQRKLPAGAWQEALEFGQRLAQTLGAWHLGVDVAFERSTGKPFVLEANAFGDLLPGLVRGGLDVYGSEIEAIVGRA
jgi:hypothetical protein